MSYFDSWPMDDSEAARRLAQLATPQNLLAVTGWVFDRFCADQDVPDGRRPLIRAAALLQWMAMHEVELTLDLPSCADELKVPVEILEHVLMLPRRPDGLNRLVPLFCQVAQARRRQQSVLRSLTIAAFLTYEDGTVCPLVQVAHRQAGPLPITTGDVVQLLCTQPAVLAERVATDGLDAVHAANRERHAGLVEPEVLAALEGALAGIESADLRARARTLVELLRMMFPRELPREVQVQAQQQKQPPASAPPPPRGGFL